MNALKNKSGWVARALVVAVTSWTVEVMREVMRTKAGGDHACRGARWRVAVDLVQGTAGEPARGSARCPGESE